MTFLAKRLFMALALTFALAACDDGRAGQQQSPQNLPLVPLTIHKQDGSSAQFKVQVARTPAEIQQGLMWVQAMPADQGMLFQFPQAGLQSFWMRNTLIPLDMLFIGAEGRVLHLHENAIPHDETPISSRFPVGQVLELNGGAIAKFGLQIGDRVVVANPAETD